MPRPSVLQVETSDRDATRVVAVTGELDLSSAGRVEVQLDAALAELPERVVIDLGGLSFCDSTGIRLVVSAHRRFGDRGVPLAIVRPKGAAWRAFEICRVDAELPFVDSLPEALEPPPATAPDRR